jgi:hypothetical protein
MNTKVVFAVGLVFVAIATPLTSRAATLQVNCDNPSSRLPTINSALRIVTGLVGSLGANTIEVTGACHENIALTGVSSLTLTAQPGASITDASGGTKPVIDVERSTDFALNGFAIRGGGGPFLSAVLCGSNSTCYFSNNNVQVPNFTAITALLGSAVALDHDVLEQSGGGLAVISGSRAVVTAATIRNNAGNGVLVVSSSFFNAVGATNVANNGANGVFVAQHSQALLGGGLTITGNGSAGVFANDQSDATFFIGGNTISGNRFGVAIQDMSWAGFVDASTVVSGSATQPDILCWGNHSGARLTAANGTTNCPPP